MNTHKNVITFEEIKFFNTCHYSCITDMGSIQIRNCLFKKIGIDKIGIEVCYKRNLVHKLIYTLIF